MQRQLLILLFIFATTTVFGQTRNVSSEILSQEETSKLFTDSVCKHFGITYSIFRVYKCTDSSGQFYILMTESNDSITIDRDTLNYNIKALYILQDKNRLLKKWEINDFITQQANSNEMENSIWFWTKYSEFTDIDHDGLIDPIIIYGTRGINHARGDGRIKILIYYKGQKFAIRHQNGVLDFERNTYVDKGFYSLPLTIQDHIKMIMKKMMDDNNAIFPNGWQESMINHEIYFDEIKR